MSDGTRAVANERQASEWGGQTGRHWVERQAHYDAMLARLTTRLMSAAGLSASDRVLDVGCGCGHTTRIAATHAATAVGVDLSAPMLAHARSLAEREGHDNIRFEQADAQVHPFPDGVFDVALSRFGVMFFDDPQAAFANLHRALRPGGRLTFLCWQEMTRNAHVMVPLRAVAAHLPLPEAAPPGGPGPFSLADPQHIRHLLGAARFSDVAIEPVTEPVRMGDDVNDVLSFLHENPLGRALTGEADEATAAKAIQALRAELSPHQTPDGVFLDSAAWLVTARRP
jgi:SAM-dependent methyltransferase